MVQTYPSMSLRTFLNVIKLIWHNLEDSVFSRLCHLRWSAAPTCLKLTENNATALWNPNCGVESVNGIDEHIIRNSVKNSVLSRLYALKCSFVSLAWNHKYFSLKFSSQECLPAVFYRNTGVIYRSTLARWTCLPFYNCSWWASCGASKCLQYLLDSQLCSCYLYQ